MARHFVEATGKRSERVPAAWRPARMISLACCLASIRWLDGDTILVSLRDMLTDITSKMLHEKTGQVLDRLRQGERFRVLRDGTPDGILLPASDAVDPEWSEIMAEVWSAQKPTHPIPNPVLKERKTRKYAARLR